MPDGWTKRIFCIVCHGEWFTPHPYLMRKDPFKAVFHMPGGIIEIEIGDQFSIRMTGPVTRVSEGVMDPEIFRVEK